jgi:phosphohistidine phosphatase
MKSLSLFRHAKTERDSASGRDFDRALTDRGHDDARRVGDEIRNLGLRYGLVLASPAVRSVETVEGAKLESPRYDERIYDASAGQLLDIVHEVDNGVDRLILVGHNPGFERLASRLSGQEVEMPTGALMEIELPIDDWRNAGEASCRIVRFIKPKELD